MLAAAIFVCSPVLSAQDSKNGNGKDDEKNKFVEKQSVQHHKITIAGETVPFRSRAGTMEITLGQGKDKREAYVFYVAYTRTGVENRSERPITFSFNGGPGSSSVWLHLGCLGPWQVQIPDDASMPRPPYKLRENPLSLIDKTDLVFIDPVSTGYSRAKEGTDPEKFHGVRKDIRSVGRFIHNYVTDNERWGSPRFLIGESYGTTRAAGLSLYMQKRYGMEFSGLMLVSSILNFRIFSRGQDLKNVLRLPTYTVTAWYHEQLDEELQKRDLTDLLDEVESFSVDEYNVALMKGDELEENRKTEIAKALSDYTGLPKEYVLREDLRVPMSRFNKQLMREENRTVGRFDSRFTGQEADRADDSYEYDPSYAAVSGAFTEGIYRTLRDRLNFKSNRVYEVLTRKVHPWDYGRFESMGEVNVARRLRKAMHKNPHLDVLVASGYYDQATPYFAAEYTFNHMGLSERAKDNVRMTYYKAGHMMYIRGSSMKKMRKDLVSFLKESK